MPEIVIDQRFFVYVPNNAERQINKYVRPKRNLDYEQPKQNREYYNNVNFKKLNINIDTEDISEVNTDVSVTCWNAKKISEPHNETPTHVDPYFGGTDETLGNRTFCLPLMIKRAKSLFDSMTNEEKEEYEELHGEPPPEPGDFSKFYLDVVHVEAARCRFAGWYDGNYDKVWIELLGIDPEYDSESSAEDEAENTSTVYRNQGSIGTYNDLLNTEIEDAKSTILKNITKYEIVLSAQVAHNENDAKDSYIQNFPGTDSLNVRFINRVYEWIGKVGVGTLYPGEPDISKDTKYLLITLRNPDPNAINKYPYQVPAGDDRTRMESVISICPNNQSIYMIPLGKVTQASRTAVKVHETKKKPKTIGDGSAKHWNYVKYNTSYCTNVYRGILPSIQFDFDNTRTRHKIVAYIIRDKKFSEIPSGFSFIPFIIPDEDT